MQNPPKKAQSYLIMLQYRFTLTPIPDSRACIVQSATMKKIYGDNPPMHRAYSLLQKK